jgi:hypothetical protein
MTATQLGHGSLLTPQFRGTARDRTTARASAPQTHPDARDLERESDPAGSFERAGPALVAQATATAKRRDDRPVQRDEVRSELVRRLHCRSDDFAATKALCALEAYSAGLESGQHGDAVRLMHAGLSCNARIRAWRLWRSPTGRTKQ